MSMANQWALVHERHDTCRPPKFECKVCHKCIAEWPCPTVQILDALYKIDHPLVRETIVQMLDTLDGLGMKGDARNIVLGKLSTHLNELSFPAGEKE